MPIHQHTAARDIVKARNEVANGGFAAARSTHQCKILPCTDVQVQLLQHRGFRVVGVGKIDLLEADVARGVRQVDGRRGFGDVDVGIHHLKETLNASHTTLEGLHKFRQTAHGGKQRAHIQQVGDEVGRGDFALCHKQATHQNEHQIHQPIKRAGDGMKNGEPVVVLGAQGRPEMVALVELFALLLLACKCLDHTHTQQSILHLGVDFARLLAHVTPCFAQLFGHADDGKQNQW